MELKTYILEPGKEIEHIARFYGKIIFRNINEVFMTIIV